MGSGRVQACLVRARMPPGPWLPPVGTALCALAWAGCSQLLPPSPSLSQTFMADYREDWL